MPATKIKWSSLLRYAEIEFDPAPPTKMVVADELVQTLSWLTAATRQDRRIIRCTPQGALLVADAWCGLNSVGVAQLYPQNGTPAVDTPSVEHKAVLISTSNQLIKLSFVRKSGETPEDYYVPPNSNYFFPYPVYSVTATVVPASGGTASYVGVVYLI